MKRKLFLGSTMVSALVACSASAQVVNFHDDANGDFNDISHSGDGFTQGSYAMLFAGQGAYPDPGNNVWNGFGGQGGGVYGSTYYYTGDPGSSGNWPEQYGNPGNPYACYNNGTVSGGPGTSLFVPSGSPSTCGNATSAAQWTPITLDLVYGDADNGWGSIGGSGTIPDGAPEIILGECAIVGGGGSMTITLGNVASGTYGLYIYSANHDNNRGAIYTLETANGGNAHNGINATRNANDSNGRPDPFFAEGSNFCIFENITPDSSGNIVITGAPNPADVDTGEVDFNGLQLIANPLPTAVGMTVASNVYSGGTATFTFSPVFADESTATPTYQWQFSNNGGVSWSPVGGNSTTLTVPGATSVNAGAYRCMITDNVTTAVGYTPLASLSILTSTATNVLEVGDVLSDVNNNLPWLTVSTPGNSVPPPLFMATTKVEDQTLYGYLNYGANGSVAPFSGPAGFIVEPVTGSTIVTGMRIFTASTHPEDDPINYTLQGSTVGTGGPWTTISSGTLTPPLARNGASGAINISNEALQEIDFANSQYAVAYQLTFSDVRNDTLASNGVQVAEVQLLGLAEGPPSIISGPSPVLTEVPACPTGVPVTLSVTAAGTGPLNYQWIENGTTTVQTGTNFSYTFTAPSGSNNYTVTVSGAVSPPVTSSAAIVLGLTTPPPVITFNDGTGWTVNESGGYTAGDPTFLSPTEFEITDGHLDEWGSIFFDTPQYVGGFIASYVYAASSGADGMTFCVQNSPSGVNALGIANGGGGLGYSTISNSFAFEMDIYNHGTNGIGPGTVGGPGIAYGTGGATPYTVTPPPVDGYYATGSVGIDSGDNIFVQLYYMNGVLNVTLLDENSLAIYTTNVVENLPAIVGSESAYVGLTGASGGIVALQLVSDFQFSYTTAPILSIANGTPGNVVVSWPLSVSSLFTLYESSSLLGPWTAVGVTPTFSGCENTVTLPASGQAQYFELSLDPPVQ